MRPCSSVLLRRASLAKPAGHRNLHMTGAATYASKLLTTSDRKSTSAPVRLTGSESCQSSPFNTSRALKTVGDNSTIDFAFLPDPAEFGAGSTSSMTIKMPTMPEHGWMAAGASAAAAKADADPIRPQIYTVAADGTHISSNSALSPVLPASDDVDLGPVSPTVAGSARAAWSGFLDDVLGSKPAGSPSVA